MKMTKERLKKYVLDQNAQDTKSYKSDNLITKPLKN